MKANIYSIAEEAGVSISTVSRVLNNSRNVSSKTRKKVQDIINKRNYVPSDAARGLVTKKTMNIGILVTDIRNPFHSNCSYELETRLRKLGYMTILANTTDEIEKQIKYMNLLFNRGVDGLFLVGSGYVNPKVKEVCSKISESIAVVGINTGVVENNCVLLDEKEGIRISLNYLRSKGYNKPAYIGVKSLLPTRASINKIESFKYFSSKMFNINSNTYKLEVNDKEYIKFLDKVSEYDVIQFESDDSALRFMKIVEKNNISIPKDLAIVGFDNLSILNYGIKRLSTIDHKYKQLCKIGVDKLINQINNKKFDKVTIVKPSFVLGETT